MKRAINKLVPLTGIGTQIRVDPTAELTCNGYGLFKFPLKLQPSPNGGRVWSTRAGGRQKALVQRKLDPTLPSCLSVAHTLGELRF